MRKHSINNDASVLINHSAYFTSCYESAHAKYINIRKHSTDNNASALINYSAYFTSCYESARVKYINMSEHNVKSNASIQEKRSNNVKKNHEDAYNNINS